MPLMFSVVKGVVTGLCLPPGLRGCDLFWTDEFGRQPWRNDVLGVQGDSLSVSFGVGIRRPRGERQLR